MPQKSDITILGVDRVIHEPARLLLLTILSRVAASEFKFLESATGLTKGNLSSHLAKLENAGYVAQNKRFRGKIPVTTISITTQGRKRLRKYQGQLKSLVNVPGREPGSADME